MAFLEAETRKKLSFKVGYHLKKQHGARFLKELRDCREQGGQFEGLALRQMIMPVAFKKLAASEAGFSCPWCNDSLPKDIKGSILKKSKKHHMEVCRKRPKSLPTLWQFHSMGIGRTNGMAKRYRVVPVRGGGAYAKMGHKVHKIQLRNLRQGRIHTVWFCSVCNTTSLSDCLRKKCCAKLNRRSPSFWRHVEKDGKLEAALADAANPALSELVHKFWRWIRRRSSMAMISCQVKIPESVWWCRRCNATKNSRWYYRKCRGQLITRSSKFWERVAWDWQDKEPSLIRTLWDDSEKQQLQAWIHDLDGQQGHQLFKVELKSSKRGQRTFVDVCKRCNGHTMGGVNGSMLHVWGALKKMDCVSGKLFKGVVSWQMFWSTCRVRSNIMWGSWVMPWSDYVLLWRFLGVGQQLPLEALWGKDCNRPF